MTSSSGGISRVLVACCCVMFISMIFLSAGYVRLELELGALKEKFEVIEQHVKTIGKTKDPPFLNRGNTYFVECRSDLHCRMLFFLPFFMEIECFLIKFGNILFLFPETGAKPRHSI